MKLLRTIFAGLATLVVAKGAEPKPDSSPASAMREMRLAWLTRVPEKTEYKSDDEVVAVLMDWPLGEQTATILASSGGDASLYTTATFGIIGGIGHESVRKAAAEFAHCAQRYSHLATPTSKFPYPDSHTLLFYFVTPSGVRTLSFPLAEIENEQSPARTLFAYGQQVLTELRLTTEKK